MLIDKYNTFVCWWIIVNCFIYNLNRTGKRNSKDCIGGDGVGASLAALSARLYPGMAKWPEIL